MNSWDIPYWLCPLKWPDKGRPPWRALHFQLNISRPILMCILSALLLFPFVCILVPFTQKSYDRFIPQVQDSSWNLVLFHFLTKRWQYSLDTTSTSRKKWRMRRKLEPAAKENLAPAGVV
jgi:hypothetical protein